MNKGKLKKPGEGIGDVKLEEGKGGEEDEEEEGEEGEGEGGGACGRTMMKILR